MKKIHPNRNCRYLDRLLDQIDAEGRLNLPELLVEQDAQPEGDLRTLCLHHFLGGFGRRDTVGTRDVDQEPILDGRLQLRTGTVEPSAGPLLAPLHLTAVDEPRIRENEATGKHLRAAADETAELVVQVHTDLITGTITTDGSVIGGPDLLATEADGDTTTENGSSFEAGDHAEAGPDVETPVGLTTRTTRSDGTRDRLAVLQFVDTIVEVVHPSDRILHDAEEFVVLVGIVVGRSRRRGGLRIHLLLRQVNRELQTGQLQTVDLDDLVLRRGHVIHELARLARSAGLRRRRDLGHRDPGLSGNIADHAGDERNAHNELLHGGVSRHSGPEEPVRVGQTASSGRWPGS